MTAIEVNNCEGGAELMAETDNAGGFYINSEQMLLVMGDENLRIVCLAFMPGTNAGVMNSKHPMEWDGGGLLCPLANNECIRHTKNPESTKSK